MKLKITPVPEIPAGTHVTVSTDDGYVTHGQLLGFTRSGRTGQHVIVLGEDRLERHVPLPATITRR